MPQELGNLLGSSQCMLYYLITLCALTQPIIAATTTLSSTNISDSKICVYHNKRVFCRESDQYCLSAVYTNIFESSEDYVNLEDEIPSLSIVCSEQPKNVTQLLDKFYSAPTSKRVELYLKNCYELPPMFLGGNMSYIAKLEYESNNEKNVNILRHVNDMRALVLDIKSYVADEKWLGAFLRFQHTLKRLTLWLYSIDPDIILSVDSFSELNELQELQISIKNKKGAVETVTATKRTSLRNLTRAHLSNLTRLKRLFLIGNNMQAIESGLFSALHELNDLSLRANALRQLAPDLFAAQHKLCELDLGGNHLDSLPPQLFTHTPLLFILRLDRNHLYALGNMLATLKPLNYLKVLDLGHNQFANIVHDNETLLTHINLKQPPWDDLKQTRKNPPYPVLDVSHNRLTHFSWDWVARAEVPCNVQIKLTHNRIRHFHALKQPTRDTPSCAPLLQMNENPLHCDCQLAWIYSLDFSASTIGTSTTNWHCATPPQLKARALRILHHNELCKWNALFCPAKCTCTYGGGEAENAHDALFINCTGGGINAALAQLPRPEQVGLIQTTLYIAHCNLTELPPRLNAGYANVTRLHAAANNISTISVSHLPHTLLLLDLRANNLQRLSADFLAKHLNESTHLQALYLSGNPWQCDCEALQLLRTVRIQRARIPDIEKSFCADRVGVSLLRVQITNICRKPESVLTSIIVPLFALALTAVILLILIALYYKYKIEVKIWLYAHNLCALWISEDELDQNKTFDAFISYAHQQNDYVNHVLLPGLEQGPPAFRVCIHERNWLAGACIPDQIVKSVDQSCRTVFVLSQDFIASDWGRMEFRTAHQSALNEGRARIIFIKYGELSNLQNLDKELQAYLKMNTYLEWNDPRFWQKLRYAMPHRIKAESDCDTIKMARRVYIPD